MFKIGKCSLLKIILLIAIMHFILLTNNTYGIENKINKEIEKVINKKNIDIARLALTTSKLVFPETNIENELKQIDQMVKDIKKSINKKNDPYYKIGSINDYLYKTKEFSYDMQDMGARNLANQFLAKYLELKKGSCITMPLLYYIIGSRLGLPLFWVRAPEHFFCRYRMDDGTFINLEATSGGKAVPDESYINDFKISENEINKGIYMKNLSSKGCIADLLCILALYYTRQAENRDAINYLNASLTLYPENALAYRSLSVIYRNMGMLKEADESLEKAVLYGYEERDRFAQSKDAKKDESENKKVKNVTKDTTSDIKK